MFQTEYTFEMRTHLLPNIINPSWDLKSGISWIDLALPLLNMRYKIHLLAKKLEILVEGFLRELFMLLLEGT